MDKNFTDSMIEALADIPIPSTEYMCQEDKCGGVAQMIDDLETLARKDGCIAAAWALEVLREISKEKVKP